MEVKSETGEVFDVQWGKSVSINGREVQVDVAQISNGVYHLMVDGNSHDLVVHEFNPGEGTLEVETKGKKVKLSVVGRYAKLLDSLGIAMNGEEGVDSLKAPMPGMVLDVLAKTGDVVKKGDKLVVLEAMKMENVIKSPVDGTISKIIATKGESVEKNDVLISFS